MKSEKINDMYCYIYLRFSKIALLEVEVNDDHIKYLKFHNKSETPGMNYKFFPPFNEELKKVLEQISVTNEKKNIFEDINYGGKSIGSIANDAFKYYDGVEIVFVKKNGGKT